MPRTITGVPLTMRSVTFTVCQAVGVSAMDTAEKMAISRAGRPKSWEYPAELGLEQRRAVGPGVRAPLGDMALVGLRTAVVIEIKQRVLVIFAPFQVAIGHNDFVAVAHSFG